MGCLVHDLTTANLAPLPFGYSEGRLSAANGQATITERLHVEWLRIVPKVLLAVAVGSEDDKKADELDDILR